MENKQRVKKELESEQMQQLNSSIENGVESIFVKGGRFYVNNELIGNFAENTDDFKVKKFKII